MPRVARAALAAVLLAVVLGVVVPAARADIGISDTQPAMFGDWRFTDLGVRQVRLVVPWDIAVDKPQQTDAFLAAAQAAGVNVHVAFEHLSGDQCPGSPCTLPGVQDFRTAFVAFRNRWPQVTSFTAWNEASHETQPTQDDPARAAAYYDTIVDMCPTCEVVAADVLGGDPGLAQWLRAFRTAARHPPLLYGLHDYSDANRSSTADLDGMLSMIGGGGARLWITETGGIVRFRTRDGVETMGYDESRAARAIGWALAVADAYAAVVPRTYIYSFTGGGRMDTGLIGLDGTTRAGYDVLLQYQRAHATPPLPRPPGTERERAPSWDQHAPVDPSTGLPAGGTTVVPRLSGPRRTVLRSPRVRRVGRRGLRLLLSCPSGAPRCTGTVRASGIRRTTYRIRAGGRTTVLLHCLHRPRTRATLRLTFTQSGVKPWRAKVTVR
jgi:hypothetical protein